MIADQVQFLTESFQHEQKQILMLMDWDKRLPKTADRGNLIYALSVVVEALQALRDGKLDFTEALQRYHIVSKITNDNDIALCVAGIEKAKQERFQRWNDQLLDWQRKGWVELVDDTYDLTPSGRENLLRGQLLS